MIVVFRVEFKVFALVLHFRIIAECIRYLSDWHHAFLRGRGTPDVHYIANQLFRAICLRGERAAAVHVDYSSAFDSISHIYLFHAIEKAGASSKTLQLYKAIYMKARVVAKFGRALSEPLGIGRGVLEGDINSPIFFSIGLEAVFREADEITSILALPGGVELRGTAYDKIAFADDVTATGGDVADMSHRVQILQLSSSKDGLEVSRPKSCAQHLGSYRDAPAVTVDDIQDLKLKYECPKPWCTHRFPSKAAVRGHVTWHEKREGGTIDQDILALGQVVGARGPPEHRFFMVLWLDGRHEWLLHKCFTPRTYHLFDLFFLIHHRPSRK